MSWKQAIIGGVLTGAVLGSGAYVALSRIGAELMLQSTYEPYTIQSVQGCGLEPESACVALDGVVYGSLVVQDKPLKAVHNVGGMQPFAPALEDELTAVQRLQDTRSPQVTKHGYYLQQTANSGRLQGATGGGSWE